MIYTDRSRIVARGECPRLGWLGYEAEGKGWAPKATPLPLAGGIVIHDAFSKLLTTEAPDVQTIVLEAYMAYHHMLNEGEWTPEKDFLYKEQCALIGGIIYTFAYHKLPSLLAEFEVATFPLDGKPFVEKEFTVEIDRGIKAMLRMDAVLRRKSTGELVILDYKTLSYVSNDWMDKWRHNAQTYLYTYALKRFMGPLEEVEGIMYLGIVKGMRRTETGNVPWKGRKVQVSPYCYGYQSPEGEIQLDYTAKKGWKKVAAWEVSNAKAWFEEVLRPAHWDNDLFNTLFIHVPPIAPVAWEVERWLRQVSWQEYLNDTYKDEIRAAKARGDEGEVERLLDTYFPTNEERCFKYGAENKCVFLPLCFTRDPDPVALDFIPRVPHHETELEAA